MKTCPFCAEEIQDAAIVCKHCGRDLITPGAPARRPPRWGRIVLVVGVLIGAFLIALLFIDTPEMAAFKVRRAAWHEKCDQYRNTPLSNPAANACNDELNALVAYGKQRGW
jgi:hypothetical protein